LPLPILLRLASSFDEASHVHYRQHFVSWDAGNII